MLSKRVMKIHLIVGEMKKISLYKMSYSLNHMVIAESKQKLTKICLIMQKNLI